MKRTILIMLVIGFSTIMFSQKSAKNLSDSLFTKTKTSSSQRKNDNANNSTTSFSQKSNKNIDVNPLLVLPAIDSKSENKKFQLNGVSLSFSGGYTSLIDDNFIQESLKDDKGINWSEFSQPYYYYYNLYINNRKTNIGFDLLQKNNDLKFSKRIRVNLGLGNISYLKSYTEREKVADTTFIHSNTFEGSSKNIHLSLGYYFSRDRLFRSDLFSISSGLGTSITANYNHKIYHWNSSIGYETQDDGSILLNSIYSSNDDTPDEYNGRPLLQGRIFIPIRLTCHIHPNFDLFGEAKIGMDFMKAIGGGTYTGRSNTEAKIGIQFNL